MRRLICAFAALAMTACGSFAPGRYVSNDATAAAIRQAGAKNVALASLTRSASFMPLCRTNFLIEAPEGLSFEGYIQRAILSELRAAGAASDSDPARVTLRGDITELEFSASTNLVGGQWSIKLDLTSSNGRKASFSEAYVFEAGFMGHAACRRTAEAFLPAVERLIAGMAASPAFRDLLTP